MSAEPHQQASRTQSVRTDPVLNAEEKPRSQTVSAPSAQTAYLARHAPAQLTPAEVLQLQRTVGNRAVVHLMRLPSTSPRPAASQGSRQGEVIQRKPPKTLKMEEFGKQTRDKEHGTKGGAWHERKGEEWLVKGAGGYGEIINASLAGNVISDIMAIREAMAGDLYRLFLGKQHVPKTRLVETKSPAEKYKVASKGIAGFKHYHKHLNKKEEGFGSMPPSNPSISASDSFEGGGVTDQAGFTKTHVASQFFGEEDVKHDNIGFGEGTKHFKIDHGFSLGDQFLRTDPDTLAAKLTDASGAITISGLSAPVDVGAKSELLMHIAGLEDKEILEITTYYENLLKPYRAQYGSKINYMVGTDESYYSKNIIAKRDAIRKKL